MSKVSYPLRVFFDCSTAHLSEASSTYLNVHAAQGDELVAPTPYGWFIWVGDGDRDSLPADLVGITEYARRLGAEYILFDRDAPEDEELATFLDRAAVLPASHRAHPEIE